MLPNGRRLGAHLPLGDGLVNAADRAVRIGASALQVFTDNPTSWHRRATLPHDLGAFRERLAAADVAPVSVHAPYLVNLAGPEPVFFERSVAVLANELRVAAAYGASFVNVHIGSHRGFGVEAGVERLVDGMARVLSAVDGVADDVVLVLENGAGGGFGMGSSIAELALIEEAAAAAGIERHRFGWCLDTAHLWGAGHAIDSPAGVDEVLASFDRAIGLGRLRLVHLNDSRSELGSRSDRHEHVAAGRIGGAGLARVLTHPGLDHVPFVLETPGMEDGYDAVNLDRARALVAGRPLADLPAEAFHTRSAKGRSAPPDPGAERRTA